MRIGILVHSKTGKTASFARHVAEHLRSLGHEPEVVKLQPEGTPRFWARAAALEEMPNLSSYELLVLGAPTWLGPSPVALGFLESAPGLKEMRVYPFVTHMFPRFMGGNRAVKTLQKAASRVARQAFAGRPVRIVFSPNAESVKTAAAEMAADIARAATSPS